MRVGFSDHLNDPEGRDAKSLFHYSLTVWPRATKLGRVFRLDALALSVI